MYEIINVENQTVVEHSGRYDTGYFHTYENLDLDNFKRKIHVYLPAEYSMDTLERYPVVYMNDGNTAFEAGGIAPWSWEVDKTLHSLYTADLINKVIIVAIYPLNRTFEYLKTRKYIEIDGSVCKSGGGLFLYTDFITHQLKPFIDRNYRTKPEACHTSIIGSSFGGLAAFYIATTRSMYFGNAGVLSPSFWVGTKKRKTTFLNTPFMRDVVEHLKRAKNLPNIWIDWGSNEKRIYQRVPRVIKYLTKHFNYVPEENLFAHEDPIGNHDERAWEYRFNLILQKFYSKDVSSTYNYLSNSDTFSYQNQVPETQNQDIISFN